MTEIEYVAVVGVGNRPTDELLREGDIELTKLRRALEVNERYWAS